MTTSESPFEQLSGSTNPQPEHRSVNTYHHRDARSTRRAAGTLNRAGFHSTSDGDAVIRSAGLTFNYFGIVNENGNDVFFWQANGGVTEDLSGKDATGCDHSGHVAVSHSPWGDQIDANPGYLEIKTSLDGYSAKVEDPSHGFTGTTACPGPLRPRSPTRRRS